MQDFCQGLGNISDSGYSKDKREQAYMIANISSGLLCRWGVKICRTTSSRAVTYTNALPTYSCKADYSHLCSTRNEDNLRIVRLQSTIVPCNCLLEVFTEPNVATKKFRSLSRRKESLLGMFLNVNKIENKEVYRETAVYVVAITSV